MGKWTCVVCVTCDVYRVCGVSLSLVRMGCVTCIRYVWCMCDVWCVYIVCKIYVCGMWCMFTCQVCVVYMFVVGVSVVSVWVGGCMYVTCVEVCGNRYMRWEVWVCVRVVRVFWEVCLCLCTRCVWCTCV